MITLEMMSTADQNPPDKRPAPPLAKAGGESGMVMGWRLPGERLTAAGWAVALAVFVLPVLAVGLLLDALVQLVFGWCLGVWCWF